jgi:hypothetical protein
MQEARFYGNSTQEKLIAQQVAFEVFKRQQFEEVIEARTQVWSQGAKER